MTYQPQPAASLLRLGREGDFSVPWPEKGGRRRAEDGDFFRSVAGLRAGRGQTGGRFSFTGRKSEGTESELIKSSVELPGTPVCPLSALSPVHSGNMSRLLPAGFRLFPHTAAKVPFPSQAEQTGGLDWRQASPSILSGALLVRLAAGLRCRGLSDKQNQDCNGNHIWKHGQNL